MFPFLGVLLLWSLLTFGSVLPHSIWLLVLTWLAGISVYLIAGIVRRDAIDLLLIACWCAGLLSVFLIGPKAGVLVLAILWSWRASQSRPQETIRFFYLILLIGVLEAIIGLVQYFVAPGWILGYQNTSGNVVSGTLINRNHFAGLLEMMIPISFGLAFVAIRRYRDNARSYIFILAGAFVAVALIFSLSRMGVFSFLVTLLFMLVLLQLRQSERRLAPAMGLAFIGLFMAGALWIGIDAIVERYAALVAQDVLINESRTQVFRDTLNMIGDHPSGTGVGTYQDVFRQYQTTHLGVLFDHAHNDYLETTAEWGIVPAAVFWIGIVLVLFKSIQAFLKRGPIEEQGILLACSGSILSLLIHSFADFNLQIPSNGLLFCTFVGISLGTLLSRRQGTGSKG